MGNLPLLAIGDSSAERGISLPTPAGPAVPASDVVPLDVLVNSSTTATVRGATLTFPPGSARATPLPDPTEWGYWGHAFWETWPIESWIMPMLDQMAAQGANVVAFKGGPDVYRRGYISEDEYLARWVDTVNYAKALGLRCYVSYGDGTSNVWPFDVGVTVNAERIGRWAAALAATDNVIGVDVINEVWITSHTDDSLAQYIDAVKATGLPATYDFSMSSSATTSTFGPLVRSRLDYLDFHRYTDVTTSSVSDWRANNSTLPNVGSLRAIFGEFGIEASATPSAAQARYLPMGDLVTTDNLVAGACAFAWTDFVDPDNPQAPDEASVPKWGLHSVASDRTTTQRQPQFDSWATWPTARP